MHGYYSWVSPQPGYLAIGCTAAARVARYLLPDIPLDRGGRTHCSGIPGLRLVGTGRGRIRLAHFPTGGVLELHDNNRWSAAMMVDLLRLETCHSPEGLQRYESGECLWQRADLDAMEAADLADWTLASHAPVLSAVMARIDVLWRHWCNGAELDINPSTDLPRLSWWGGLSTLNLARLLISSDIEVVGAQWLYGQGHTLVIALHDSRLELRGPASGLTTETRSEEHPDFQERYLSVSGS